MALINCSECQREVSDRAQSCPHCGSPIAADHVTLTLTGVRAVSIGKFGKSGQDKMNVDVYLNGELRASIPPNSTETVVLPTGGRVDFVYVMAAIGKTKELRSSFDVPNGTNAVLGFKLAQRGIASMVLEVTEPGSGPTTFFGVSMPLDFD